MTVYPPNTEPIYAALFSLASGATISSVPAFKSSFRRPISFPQLGQIAQPALRMQQVKEKYESGPNNRIKVWLYVWFWIFAQTGLPMDHVCAATTLNALKDAVIAAIQGPGWSEGNQTLNGLVMNAWPEGDIEIDEGPNDPQGIVRIPVTILAMDPGA
jgi:hypothetical protein